MFLQVDQQFINALESTISKSRLNAYRQYFNCNNDVEAISAYLWNKGIAAAFYPLVQAAEITLRNAIHSAATTKFSGNAEWFLMKRFPPSNELKSLYTNSKTGQAKTPKPSTDQVVSSLTFGFWTGALNTHYDDPVYNRLLWPASIPLAFPNANGTNATRKELFQRFKFIKDFRNRVGHYEPLWKIRDNVDGSGRIIKHGPTNPQQSILRLFEYADLISEAIYWMSEERYRFIINTGVVSHIKSVCSLESLECYQNKNPKKIVKLNKLTGNLIKQAKTNSTASGVFRVTTPKKGVFNGQDIILEIKQISPPKFK
jgi:hypothetical protein